MKLTISPQSLMRLAVLIAFIGSSILGIAMAQTMEEDRILGINSNIKVRTPLDKQDAENFLKDLNKLSLEEDVTIVVDRIDHGQRNLYLAEGGNGTRWIKDGYHGFSPTRSYVTHSLIDLPHSDIRQAYMSSGGEKFNQRISELAESFSLETSADKNLELLFFIQGPLGTGVPLLAFVGISLTAYGTYLNRRKYAILSLNGSSFLQILNSDLRSTFQPIRYHIVTAITASALALGIYTSWDGALYFGKYFGILFTINLLSILSTWIIGLIVMGRESISLRLNGSSQPKISIYASYSARIISCILLAASAIGFWNTYPELQRQTSMEADIHRLEDFYRVSISASRTTDGLKEDQQAFIDTVNPLLKEGKALEYAAIDNESGIPITRMTRSGSDLLLSQEARNTLNKIPRDEAVLLYNPHHFPSQLPEPTELIQNLSDWVYTDKDLCSEYSCRTLPINKSYSSTNLSIPASSWKEDIVKENIPILIIPDSFRPKSNVDTLAYLSQGLLLFHGEDALHEFQENPIVRNSVFEQESLRSVWERDHDAFSIEVRVYVLSLALATTTLITLAIAFAYVCHLSWWQKYRVGFIFGRSTLRRFASIFVMEAFAIAAGLAYLTYTYLGYQASNQLIMDRFHSPEEVASMMQVISPTAIAFIALILVVSTISVISTVSRSSRNIQKTRAI